MRKTDSNTDTQTHRHKTQDKKKPSSDDLTYSKIITILRISVLSIEIPNAKKMKIKGKACNKAR